MEGHLCYLKDFKIAHAKSGSHSQIQYIGPFYVCQTFEHTNTVRLHNLLTDKQRIAHIRHLRPCVGPIVQSPIRLKIRTENLINPNTLPKKEEVLVDRTELRRLERIKNILPTKN